MAETGVLRPDARVELLNGEITDMSPIGPFHGGVVNRLIRSFTRSSSGRWLVSAQNPVRLDDYSEPEPDLMLLKLMSDDYISHHPRPEDVYLLVEVSDASLTIDREEKLPAYGRAGVPEEAIVVCDSRRAALSALEAGKRVIAADPLLLMELPLEVIVEATGQPEAGARHAEAELFSEAAHGVVIDRKTRAQNDVVHPVQRRAAESEMLRVRRQRRGRRVGRDAEDDVVLLVNRLVHPHLAALGRECNFRQIEIAIEP